MTEKVEKSDLSVSSKITLSTKVNGLFKKIQKIEGVFRFGQMAAGMMDSGKITWLMGKEG